MDINQAIYQAKEAIIANYQVIGASVGILVIIRYLYKVIQNVGELKHAKEIYDEKLKNLEQKYDTEEKIKTIEINIAKLSTESIAEKEHVREHSINLEAQCTKLESRIASLEEKMKDHKEHHPPAQRSSEMVG
jgi:hypothetical protein